MSVKCLISLFVILILLNYLDLLTTTIALSTDRFVELNPLYNNYFHVYKALAVCSVILIHYYIYSKYGTKDARVIKLQKAGLLIVIAIYVITVINNITQLLLAT